MLQLPAKKQWIGAAFVGVPKKDVADSMTVLFTPPPNTHKNMHICTQVAEVRQLRSELDASRDEAAAQAREALASEHKLAGRCVGTAARCKGSGPISFGQLNACAAAVGWRG